MVQWFGLAIATASLGLSFFVLWLRWADKGRAYVVVQIRKRARSQGGDATEFAIRNLGKGVARNVNLEFDVAVDVTGPRFQQSGRPLFPIPYLVPGTTFAVPTFLAMGVATTFEVEVSWDDTRRKRQSQTMTLHVAGGEWT